jgi:pre-mRNA-processing factor SLU7
MSSAPATKQPSHTTESIADRKKTRELAEARQSGAVAPAVDVNTGAMINPHNPEFITKRPWYLGGGDEGPSLDHQADQRLESERVELSLASADQLLLKERQRVKAKQREGKFELGMWVEALKNGKQPYQICQIVKIAKKGKEFDLKFEDGTLERKVKAKPPFGKDRIRMTRTGNRTHKIDAEEHGKETYASKRDKYHGFDSEPHMKRMKEKFEKREELRKKYRSQKDDKDGDNENKGKLSDEESDFDDSDVEGGDSDDEFVQRDEDAKNFESRLARQGGVGGAQMKVTARNLRIREDTAKYLRNLDIGSAYYDPKSRSMRDNPNPEVAPEESQFAGDNFSRISGDAVGLAETQLFAWDATDKGVAPIHPQANPSEAELLKKQTKSKRTDEKAQQKKAVLDKYGGSEYLDGSDGLATAKEKQTKSASASAAERKVRFGVSVTQEEYTRDGRLIKGGVAVKREALKSKYEEDIFVNGHTAVWGSYFHKGAFRWGYSDDHSLIRNSYCTGENGRKVNDEANEMKYGTGVAGSAALAQAREMLKAIPTTERKIAENTAVMGSKLYGEADQNATFDKEKLDAAIKKVDKDREDVSKKRKYNSVDAAVDVTEEEMEAYRMRKEQMSDPMAKISSNELLDYQ